LGELLALAFATDSTRVATMMLGNEGSNRAYPELGVPEGHHEISHRGDAAERRTKVALIERFHVTLFADVLARLPAKHEGEGALLDYSLVHYGSGISDGNRHNHGELPILLAGGGAGLRGGRPLRFAKNTPCAILFVTLLDKGGRAPRELRRFDGGAPRVELAPAGSRRWFLRRGAQRPTSAGAPESGQRRRAGGRAGCVSDSQGISSRPDGPYPHCWDSAKGPGSQPLAWAELVARCEAQMGRDFGGARGRAGAAPGPRRGRAGAALEGVRLCQIPRSRITRSRRSMSSPWMPMLLARPCQSASRRRSSSSMRAAAAGVSR
jgi:hypothetical protein